MSDQRWSNAIIERVIVITLAYAGIVGLRAYDQFLTNRCRLSRPDNQNKIGLMSFDNIWPKILPTKWQHWPNEWLLSEKLWVNFHVLIRKKNVNVTINGRRNIPAKLSQDLRIASPLLFITGWKMLIGGFISSDYSFGNIC